MIRIELDKVNELVRNEYNHFVFKKEHIRKCVYIEIKTENDNMHQSYYDTLILLEGYGYQFVDNVTIKSGRILKKHQGKPVSIYLEVHFKNMVHVVERVGTAALVMSSDVFVEYCNL